MSATVTKSFILVNELFFKYVTGKLKLNSSTLEQELYTGFIREQLKLCLELLENLFE